MQEQEIRSLIEKQNAFFASGKTLSVKDRIQALKKLKKAIEDMEEQIHQAIYADLGKSRVESYMCEVGLALSEISHMIRHTAGYAREKRVLTPMSQSVSKSFVKPSPYGTVLIMSPWNYPFLLTLDPLVDAIAAGNTAIVKPSAYSPATSQILKTLLEKCFPGEYVAVVTGGRAENQYLLRQKWDYIFFTGSQAVGREVMRHAAEHLTPVTLELGGKSPCIVDESAKISIAAKRIVFGKFLNCGQTCVAPDYILCQEKVKEDLVEALKKEIEGQFGRDPLENPAYGKIINQKQFTRITSLIQREKVIYGGQWDADRNKIAPTLLDGVTWEDPVMQEEIFGPVLPILTFQELQDAADGIRQLPHPLALYLFTERKSVKDYILKSLSFGGGCVNDTIIHLATCNMGFGGVGASGMGAYHGKQGFDTFSHKKSIVDKKTWLDLPMRYQPYTRLHEKMIRFFIK